VLGAAATCVLPGCAERSLVVSWALVQPPRDGDEVPCRRWLGNELPMFIVTFALAGALLVAWPLPPGLVWQHALWALAGLLALCPLTWGAIALGCALQNARPDGADVRFLDDEYSACSGIDESHV
jgi:hypothetical protein